MGRPIIDLTGKKFGRLIAVSVSGFDKQGKAMWQCSCSCGNKAIVASRSLIQGQTRSCGCLLDEHLKKNGNRLSLYNYQHRLPYGEAQLNDLYRNRYQRGAIKRNINFELTKEQFKEIITSDCYYCGAKPTVIKCNRKSLGAFMGTGIDRLDNSKGYTVDNCVSCCKTCNYMKRNMGEEDFYSHIRAILKNRGEM